MKIYVRASKTKKVDIDTSMFKGTPFQCYTGMSYYDDFLSENELAYKQRAKNRTGEIVMMSPEEYYTQVSLHGLSDGYTSPEELKASRRRDKKTIDKIKRDIQNGKKYCLCMLNIADHGHEGLHRMMAVGDLYGWDTKFPVLVVTPYDQEKENRWKLQDEANNFRFYRFRKYCENAEADIWGKTSPVPDDFIKLYHDAIVRKASDSGISIDVEVVVDEVDGFHRVLVYLKSYNGYEFEQLSEPYTTWLENLYDVDGEYANMDDVELDEYNINANLPEDPEDDDYGIWDLFFKKP